MFDRFFFSADLGGGDGGDAGGAVGADPQMGGDAGGVDPGAVEGQQAAQFDYESFAKPYGGPEGLQRAVQFANDIQNRAYYNPQFKETLERALRGEFGAEAQQQAQQQQAAQGGQQQQQAQQQGWLKYEPATLVQMQTFHRDLQRAKDSGDPQAVQDVWNDPMNAQARETYQKHQAEMNNQWFDPRGFHQKLWQDPEMQQMRQQEYQQAIQQAVEPLQQELAMYQKTNFYQQNQKAIDALPQHIKDAFGREVFGEITSARGWIAAIQVAMQEAQKFQTQPQHPQADQPVAQNATAETPRTNGRPAANGVNRINQPAENRNVTYGKYAEEMKKARQKDAAATKS